jgi:hypothetical protein
MECYRIRPFLDEFAEGELASPNSEMVEEHLETCASCREEVSATRRAIRLMAELGEVDEPPDFLQRVRQRIAAPHKYSIMERLLRRPVMARVFVSVGCIALVGFGAWLVFKQFSSPLPASTAKRRPEAAKKPEVIAHVHTETEPSFAGAPGEVAPAAPPVEEKPLPRGNLEPNDEYTPGKAWGASRYGGIPQGIPTTADTEGEGASPARSSRRTSGGAFLPGSVATQDHVSGQASDETQRQMALISKSGVQEKLNEPAVALSDDASGRPSHGIALEVTAGPLADGRAKEEAVRPQASTPAAVGEARGTQPTAGTGAVRQRSAQDRIAGFQSETPSEPELLPPLSQRDSQKKAVSTLGEAVKDTPLVTNDRAHGGPSPDEARGRQSSFYRDAQKNAEAPVEEKNGVESFDYDKTLHGIPTVGVRTEEGLLALEPAQTLDHDGDLDVTLGAAFSLGRYRQLGQSVRQVTLNVKDRNKALTEIKKFVEDRGGRVQPLAEQGNQPLGGRAISQTDVILVTLTPDAYKQFQRRYTPPRDSSGPALIEPQFEQAGETTERAQQQQPVVILLIRLVETVPQTQPQQPSPQ